MKPPYPPDAAPGGLDAPEPGRPGRSHSAGRLGLWLFLASLTMLFGASLVGYLAVRLTFPGAPARGALKMPPGLWVSTAFLLLAGLAIHRAQRAALSADGAGLKRWLVRAFLLSAGFVAVQAPSLVYLVRVHLTLRDSAAASAAGSTQSVGLYGLAFVLILLHAAHVIGGLIPLGWLTWRALGGRLGGGQSGAVRFCALYWHFLEIVWIVLFGTFLITA